jgi:two-component system response regulator GlrR
MRRGAAEVGKDGSAMDGQSVVREEERPCEQRRVVGTLRRGFGLEQILGHSPAVRELRDNIDRISSCDVGVLICGESGTGKELAARALHYLGPRASKPFVPVNCGAVPDSLFENELFGHAKGAFTDANYPQKGLVEQAKGGTLFLDEVGAMSPANQVKLLRLLQEEEYRPLGDPTPHRADIRVIAATNADLWHRVEAGTFREDLFYRLNVVTLYISPLRERMEDLPLLVEHFLNLSSREYGRPVEGLSPRAWEALRAYHWPGNIRELENCIRRLTVMSPTPVIDAVSFPPSGNPPSCCHTGGFERDPTADRGPVSTQARAFPSLDDFGTARRRAVDAFERSYLTQLLAEYHGDVPGAARRAGKSRTGLWNLLRKHGLSPREFRLCGKF